MRVTLQQVACEARVSYLTALRAMGSSPGRVREKTAQRVRAAAERLEYRPNPAARALTSQTSPYIGLLYGVGPGCGRRIGATEMMRAYAEFHFELTARLEAHEYHVLAGAAAAPHVAAAGQADDSANNVAIPNLLRQRHVGGLVIVGDIWPALHREIVRFRIPAVGVYCESVSHVPTVDLNYHAASRACTQHLIDLGHRRVAFAPGQWKTWKTEPMQSGYLSAMNDAGLRPMRGWDCFADTGQSVADRMSESARRPTAVVVYDDYEAVRVVDRPNDAMELEIPRDLSIASVQNMGPGAIRRPTITGCPIPAIEMARRAVDLLLKRMRSKRKFAAAVADELVETSLVPADSSVELRHGCGKRGS